MRIRYLLLVSAVAVLMSSGAIPAQSNRSGDSRWGTYNDRDYRESEREREKAWREYLKERRKAYKEWSRASREEREDFDRYWYERERYRDRGDSSWENRDQRGDYGRYPGDRGWEYEGQNGRWGYGNGPRDGACFYTDSDFRGDSFCVGSNESRSYLPGRFNDKISSIRLFGRARVIVFEDNNFHGDRRTITHDVYNLAGNFNDRISSFEVR